MGGAKKKWMELEARNLSSIPDKHIFAKHFKDKSITNHIIRNYESGYCDYCEKRMKVVALENLMEFLMGKISNFYEDAGNFMGYDSKEGGYLGEIYTPDELIQDEIGLNVEPFEIIEDIVNSIDDIAWAQPDLHYDNINDELTYQWEYFKEIIKHKSRYLFSSGYGDQSKAYGILKEAGKIVSNSNIIKVIPKGTKLFRCRQHDAKTKISSFNEICSPSNKNAIYPNRFSPSGISMFYSAFETETAILETISRENKVIKHITIAEFETLEDQNIVDFSLIPKRPSIFRVKNKKNYYLKLFLYSFVRDITNEIKKDGKEHTEYVPTQVVTEFREAYTLK